MKQKRGKELTQLLLQLIESQQRNSDVAPCAMRLGNAWLISIALAITDIHYRQVKKNFSNSYILIGLLKLSNSFFALC